VSIGVDVKQFWDVIEMFDWDRAGDDDAVIRPVVHALATMEPSEIIAFEDFVARALHLLDTREHARWCFVGEADPDDGDQYISPDEFLYARCVVVANGPHVFYSVLKNPDRFPAGLEFEALLGVASAAYQQRTGEPLLEQASVSYESFSNSKGWRPSRSTRPGRFTSAEVGDLERRPG
jgi:hypothetical protein